LDAANKLPASSPQTTTILWPTRKAHKGRSGGQGDEIHPTKAPIEAGTQSHPFAVFFIFDNFDNKSVNFPFFFLK